MFWVLNKNHLIETIFSTLNTRYGVRLQTKGQYVTLIVKYNKSNTVLSCKFKVLGTRDLFDTILQIKVRIGKSLSLFLIQNMLWVLKRIVPMRQLFWAPKPHV